MDINKTIEAFNSLIVINNDRLEGYRIASETIDDEYLQMFFNGLSQTSYTCKKALVDEVKRLGGTPDNGTRTSGKFFRAWMEIRAVLSRNDKRAILNLCAYGEEAALETYKKVLIQEVHEINSLEQNLLNQQYALLKIDYEKVNEMRNTFRMDKKLHK